MFDSAMGSSALEYSFGCSCFQHSGGDVKCAERRFRHSTASPLVRDGEHALVRSVREALNSTGYPLLRPVQIEFCEGTVRLHGSVPTYHLKQLAQSCLRQLPGIREVDNRLEVVCSRPRMP